MKIRIRLALFGALVVAASMLAFGILIGLLARAAAPDDQDKALIELVETAVADLQAADPAELVPVEPPVRIDVEASTEPFIIILDEAGTPLYSTGAVTGSPPAIPAALVVEAQQLGMSEATLRPLDEIEFRVHVRPWERSDLQLSGVAAAGQSTAFIDEQVRGVTAVIWIAGIILTIVAVGVGWLVSGRALRPLRELAETTEEIRATGDLTRRLPPARNDEDEVGVLTDSFNRMLDRLQDSQHQLSDSLEAQRRFVADASHELRTPLTTIRNNAEFLAQRADVEPTDREDALADIVTEGSRMSDLVSDLLTLAHADAGREPEMHPLDFTTLVRDVARRYENTIVNADVELVVNGDRDSLIRLVVILLDNAAKYGEDQTTVAVGGRDGSARIRVADNGPGIDPADLDKVFDRFYRADPARHREGFGLGLAIAKEIVTRHGGTIEAGNGPEGGAQFTATLPLLVN